MDFLTIALLSIVLSIVLIILGVPIAYSIGICTIGAIIIGLGPAPLTKVGLIIYNQFHSLSWIPLPLFMLMACIISQTKIGEDVFDAVSKWLARVPGGLLVSSVCGEGILSATIGNSGTTLLTVGTVVKPEIERMGYNKLFSVSTLVGGGVLGALIPPSVPMIIYAVIAQSSISKLFLAGILPGILLIVMLAAYIIITCKRHPEYAPSYHIKATLLEKIVSLRKVWPVLALIIGIIVGIYSGAATATEAGAIGVVLSLVIAVFLYRFRFKQLVKAVQQAATLTAMVCMMIIGVNCFTYVAAVSGLSKNLNNWVMGLGLSPVMVVVMINIIILVLGFIMDGLAIMMVTLPLFVPLIIGLGLDPIWFGVLAVVNIEIGLITPPAGLNLFMASTVFDVSVGKLIKSIWPVVFLLIIFLGILIAFPEISLLIPRLSFA